MIRVVDLDGGALWDTALDARELLVGRAKGDIHLAAAMATLLLAGLTDEVEIDPTAVVEQFHEMLGHVHRARCARCRNEDEESKQ